MKARQIAEAFHVCPEQWSCLPAQLLYLAIHFHPLIELKEGRRARPQYGVLLRAVRPHVGSPQSHVYSLKFTAIDPDDSLLADSE
jgi:hypothetical protein